jgi:hypothetical protein
LTKPSQQFLNCLWPYNKQKSPSMLAADYPAKNLDDMIPTHLKWAQQQALWHTLKKHSILFSGKLWKLPCKPVHLDLTNPNAKPYHGKPYQVPRSLLPLLKKKVKRLCKIGVLCKMNNSKWAAQSFAIPRKNKQIWFITNLCKLNQFLCWYPFPLPSIQKIMHTVDGLTFVSILNLNTGFWMIQLDKETQWLATVIISWGKSSYQCLAMGLSVGPDIWQEKMSAIFSDMENVICLIGWCHCSYHKRIL